MLHFFKKFAANDNLEWIDVDMHSHLLPGVDDGSKSIDETMSYITQLNDLGLSQFICTPHIFKEVYPNDKITLNPVYENSNIAIEKEFSGKVKFNLGAEYMMDNDFLSMLKTNDLFTLPNNYLLIEMSYAAKNAHIENYIFDINVKGYKPILAHPERYNYYHASFKDYKRFKDIGCLLQLNLLSLAGYYGKEVKATALRLIKENYIDLIGTDLHHQKHLDAIRDFTRSGKLDKMMGKYPLLNKKIFV